MKKIFLILIFLISCASEENLLNEMHKVGYNSFSKSKWETYRNYRCINNAIKNEYFATDSVGNPITIISCCNPFNCYGMIIK